MTNTHIHLFSDTVRENGMDMHRVSAVHNGRLIHTVVRWSELGALIEMRKWLAKNISVVEKHSICN